MRRIAIINQKGGVGKTTTTANLGAALARRGQRVLLVDLDPQANLSMYLGVETAPEDPSSYTVLVGGGSIERAVRKTSEDGLLLVPSHIDLSGAELELASTFGRETLLKDAVQRFTDDQAALGTPIDFVLYDCPPSLGLLSINGLCASNEVMVVAQTEFFALQGLSKLLGVIELVQQRLNPDLQLTGVLAALFDSRLRLAREVLGELRRFFPKETFQTTIAANVRLAESPSYGQTIFEYAPDSRGARDYGALADELLEKGAPGPKGAQLDVGALTPELASADQALRKQSHEPEAAADVSPEPALPSTPPEPTPSATPHTSAPEQAVSVLCEPTSEPTLDTDEETEHWVVLHEPVAKAPEVDEGRSAPTASNLKAPKLETAEEESAAADGWAAGIDLSLELEAPAGADGLPSAESTAEFPSGRTEEPVEGLLAEPSSSPASEDQGSSEPSAPEMPRLGWGDYIGEERSRPIWPTTPGA